MTESTEKQIKKYFCEVLKVNSDKVTADSSPNDTENWDSLNHLNLILCFEEKFGIEFELEEISYININYRNFESCVLSKLS